MGHTVPVVHGVLWVLGRPLSLTTPDVDRPPPAAPVAGHGAPFSRRPLELAPGSAHRVALTRHGRTLTRRPDSVPPVLRPQGPRSTPLPHDPCWVRWVSGGSGPSPTQEVRRVYGRQPTPLLPRTLLCGRPVVGDVKGCGVRFRLFPVISLASWVIEVRVYPVSRLDVGVSLDLGSRVSSC